MRVVMAFWICPSWMLLMWTSSVMRADRELTWSSLRLATATSPASWASMSPNLCNAFLICSQNKFWQRNAVSPMCPRRDVPKYEQFLQLFDFHAVLNELRMGAFFFFLHLFVIVVVVDRWCNSRIFGAGWLTESLPAHFGLTPCWNHRAMETFYIIWGIRARN